MTNTDIASLCDLAPGLVADIGGTNARFALSYPGEREPRDTVVLACAAFPSPAAAAAAYLAQVAPPRPPRRAAFAVASAILGDTVAMTNSPWNFSVTATQAALGLDHLSVVNDFTAVALSVPRLGAGDLLDIGGGDTLAVGGAPVAVIGPGTGLGVSALIPRPLGGWVALATEGGHVTMAAACEREAAVIAWLRATQGHVSAERVLSGPGLVNLHRALAFLADAAAEPLTPDLIAQRGLDATCPLCVEALDMFFCMLGTVAGNLALSLGARGGVALAGGILPRMPAAFATSGFRRRFEDKGRFQAYLAPIPTKLVTHPYPAFLGLAELVEAQGL